jgi:hypothetical protein
VSSAPKCGAGLCNSPNTEKDGVGKKGRKRRKVGKPLTSNAITSIFSNYRKIGLDSKRKFYPG